jgi:hypothetical protein
VSKVTDDVTTRELPRLFGKPNGVCLMKTYPSRKRDGVCLGNRDKTNFFAYIKTSTNVSVDSLVQYYQNYSSKLSRQEGVLKAAKRLKEIYNVAQRYAADLSFEPIAFLRSDKIGFPKVLNPFRELLEGSPDEKRAALTVLQLFKLIDCKGPHDTSSITMPYAGNPDPSFLDDFDSVLQLMFPSSEIESRKSSLKGSLHISGKNGPNGPAMTTSHIDRKAISGSSLESNIERLAILTENHQLLSYLQETSSMNSIETQHRNRKPAHSRLRVKYEAGGKARIFAIVDLFSQSALKPIHEFLMKWLKSQPTDGTNDHSFAAKAVREWTLTDQPIWSFDLTTATDRYPVFLQSRVMAAIFGSEIAELWEKIINDREFLVPEGTHAIRFNAGQPLGALSSWAAFAVTHHVHVQTSARRAGREYPFMDYRIIGDDISIKNDAAVANEYIGEMKEIDVPFSTPKSILPHQCKSRPSAELAKRVFTGGIEITPVPPDAVLVYMREPFGKRILIELSIDRGYERWNSPYTVQSFIVTNNEWAAMTFPLGRPLPPLKGVKVMSPYWTDPDEDPPAGFSRGWWYWEDGPWAIPEYGFKWILRSYLLKEINSAIGSANRIREELYNFSWGSTDTYQGGDWKPELRDIGQSLPMIVTYMSEGYGNALLEIRDEIEFDTLDLYRVLSKLHSYLKPEDLFQQQNFTDDKTKTRVFASKLIKNAQNIRLLGVNRFTEYTSEY